MRTLWPVLQVFEPLGGQCRRFWGALGGRPSPPSPLPSRLSPTSSLSSSLSFSSSPSFSPSNDVGLPALNRVGERQVLWCCCSRAPRTATILLLLLTRSRRVGDLKAGLGGPQASLPLPGKPTRFALVGCHFGFGDSNVCLFLFRNLEQTRGNTCPRF